MGYVGRVFEELESDWVKRTTLPKPYPWEFR